MVRYAVILGVLVLLISCSCIPQTSEAPTPTPTPQECPDGVCPTPQPEPEVKPDDPNIIIGGPKRNIQIGSDGLDINSPRFNLEIDGDKKQEDEGKNG